MIIEHKEKNITELVQRTTWSGSRLQVARRLEFTYVFDHRDYYLSKIEINLGDWIYAYDDEGVEIFRGIVFARNRTVQSGVISIVVYDRLYYLTKSKTTRKFKDVPAETIAVQICKEMGVTPGDMAKTGTKVSFIADAKTGYEIIMMAYTEASKKTKKVYMPIMDCGEVDVIEKGTLIEDYTAHAVVNLLDSDYKESIENMVNKIKIVDEKGNSHSSQANKDLINKYGMIQDVYKTDPNKNTQEEAGHLMKGIERSGSISVLGNYDCIAGYSLMIADENFTGQFWIKSDSHTFENGQHSMSLELEFENLMDKVEIEQEKKEKTKKKKTKKKRSKNPKAKKAKTVPLYMQQF